MTAKIKPKKKTRLELERALLEAHALAPFSYGFAHTDIVKASTDRLMGSGVLLQLTVLGGKEIINPVVIRDGLSADTIECLKRDIKRSSDQACEMRVKHNCEYVGVFEIAED